MEDSDSRSDEQNRSTTEDSTRSAVVPDERLDSVPDSWNLWGVISDPDDQEHQICQIPEADIWVELRQIDGDASSDDEFTVESVGTFSVDFADEINTDLIVKVILRGPGSEDISEEVRHELELLADQPKLAEQEFAARVEDLAEDLLFKMGDSDGVVHLDGWEVSPWSEPLSPEVGLFHWTTVVGNSIEGEAFDEFSDHLTNRTVFPAEPTVRVQIEDGEGLPAGFHFEGLIEAGCQPAVASDYLFTHLREMTQKEWATKRGRDPSTVSENVSKARDHLLW